MKSEGQELQPELQGASEAEQVLTPDLWLLAVAAYRR